MKRFMTILVALCFAGILHAQSLTMDAIIKAVKDGKAKELYQKALKDGMTGRGMKVSKEVDWATGDLDKELLCGTYRATKDDKNSYTWGISIDSFTASHRIQAIYTVPKPEADKIRKYLTTSKYTKSSGSSEIWEKDGIKVEFSEVVDDIYIYVKL